MNCPWCEREMQFGEITGDGRGAVRFRPEGVKYNVGELLCGVGRLEAVRNKWAVFHLPAHYCDGCRKLVIDTSITK